MRKAIIDRDMTLKQLAQCIGYSTATVSAVLNGRYSNESYQIIAKKINEELGTTGMPERIDTPSDAWCQAVKIALIQQKMSVSQLAGKLDVSRDRLSLVINGKMMNQEMVESINCLLHISMPAVSVRGDIADVRN